MLLPNYRPGGAADVDSGDLLSFPEFVRFVVNGTVEKLNGTYIDEHRGKLV